MIRVEGLTLERFLNLAAQSGIEVMSVRRASYTVLSAVVSASGYRKLKSVTPEKYTVTVEKKGGIPIGFKRLTLRIALLIGLLLAAAAIFAASLFVWDVRVSGLEYRPAAALKDELAEMGICPGAYKGGYRRRKKRRYSF